MATAPLMCLRQAIDGGFLNLDILRSDTDLDPIRDRPDFQDLIKKASRKRTIGNELRAEMCAKNPSSSARFRPIES